MVNDNKKITILIGLIFTIASGVFTMVLGSLFFVKNVRLDAYMFDAGVDLLGALICAALFFGCMQQVGSGSRQFRGLIVLVSAGFVLNDLMYFTLSLDGYDYLTFAAIMASKLIDLVMIFLFYQYVGITLEFKGKLADWIHKWIPVLMGAQALITLTNIFYPLTFKYSRAESYQPTSLSLAEDIFLVTVSLITTILIVKSEGPRNQKAAALTFIFLPIAMYLLMEGTFGNAIQYGMVLMSLVIMYCIIFHYNSSKLASTQTELNMATEIQTSMLPSIFPAFPDRTEFNLYASMDPAKEVGGDFYDFFLIDDDHLGVVIADVSGKGVPAALFMMISKTVVKNYALLGLSASEILMKSNDSLNSQNTAKMFVTTWIGILEISTGKMTCANAGHEYPAILHDGRFELLKDKHGLVLGAMAGVPYKEYEIQLEKGDKIFVYTDGVPEATSASDELYGTDRMVDALNSNVEASPEEVLVNVRASVDRFVGNAEQFDDLTMVCLEYKGTED